MISSSDEDEFLLLLALASKKRRKWVHEINMKREEYGEFRRLCKELWSCEDRFFNYFRMSRAQFETIHNLIEPHITKIETNWRKPIGSRERLSIFLRYLATGDSHQTIAFSFRVGRTNVTSIVKNVCQQLYNVLQPIYLPRPTEEMWKKIETGFKEWWQFPNCIGSIDGKHISKDGNQSRYVCPKCAHKIDLFYVFKTNCKRAEKLQKSSKDRVPQKEKTSICSSNENIRFVNGSEKTASAVADEQYNEEHQDPNQIQLPHSPSVLVNSLSQDIIGAEQHKITSNNCCVLTGVNHYYDTDKECVLEEEIFPAEDFRYGDASGTALVYNTFSFDHGTLESERHTLKFADSSKALVSVNDEHQRKTNNILPKSFCVTNKCASRLHSDKDMRTTSEITQQTVQKRVLNNSLDVFNSDRVAQPFMSNVDCNELSSHKNGSYNVVYLTGLNENGDCNNLLVHSDKVFYTSAILYDAFLHDLPLEKVLKGSTYVPPFLSSFIRCSYCEKLFRCMRSHVLHKSVCQKFFQCRYCRKKFVSKILRQLHHLNECAFRRICHDHGYAQVQGHKVTEETLMKMAKVCLHRLHICIKCKNIFRTEDHLISHKTTCQRKQNQCRSPPRVSRTRESLRYFENRTIQSLDMYPVNNIKKESCMTDVKNKSSITTAVSKHCMLRNSILSVKTRSAASAQSKTTVKRKDISDGTSVLYAVGLVKKN